MIKQIRKTKKTLNKKASPLSRRNRSRSTSRSRKSSKVMRGGDAGRYVLPPSYFGNKPDGYYAEGSPELLSGGKQHAVSQGTVWENGEYAGPNLYPSMKMSGGGFSVKNKFKKSKSKKSKSKKSKSKKSKSKKSKSNFVRRMRGGGDIDCTEINADKCTESYQVPMDPKTHEKCCTNKNW